MTTETKEIVDIETILKDIEDWAVIFHNDNVTPFEYVLSLLITVFNKSSDEALGITLDIHNKGKGVVFRSTKELADEKKRQCELFNARYNMSLKITVEKV